MNSQAGSNQKSQNTMPRWAYCISIVALIILVLFWAGVYSLTRFFPNSKSKLQRAAFHNPVHISRDNYGVPTLESEGIADLIRGQGLITARDRFFQMELIRRKMAGRLSELFGEKTVALDISHRQLGYEQVAVKSLALMDSTTREVWEAYAQGVNDYLANETLPWEMKVLGVSPEPWRAEDGLLVVLSMFEALNEPDNGEELAYNELSNRFSPSIVKFLTWDFGFLDSPIKSPKGFSFQTKTPTPQELNLRPQSSQRIDLPLFEREVYGSNAWVVSGQKTTTGKPLLAGDPHLNLTVPNIWYRSELKSKDLNVRGVSVPGIPGIIIGRNPYFAWSFTNSRADVIDFIELGSNFIREIPFKIQNKLISLVAREEEIRVKGGSSKKVKFWDSPFGPIVEEKVGGQKREVPSEKRILQWTALDPVPLSKLNPLELGSAKNLDQIWNSLSRWGGPVQNILIATKDSHIAWGMVGKIPDARTNFGKVSARLEVASPWKGYISWNEMPRVVDPEEGFIGNGNQNMWIEPAGSEKWGHDWPNPARGYQIRQLLSQPKLIDVDRMENIQNELYSPVHVWYRDQFLDAIKKTELQGKKLDPWLDQIVKMVGVWDGKVAVDSAAYSFLKEFRLQVQKNCVAPFVSRTSHYRHEQVLNLLAKDNLTYRLLNQKPHHLLNPLFSSWEELLLMSAFETGSQMARKPAELPRLVWGKRNVSQIKHPFSSLLPRAISRLINFPERELSGDGLVVRVNKPKNGASMRMVIDLSDFKNSRFSQPGGQSGYFLSPYYQDLFESWYLGRGVSFEAVEVESRQEIVP